MPEWLKDWWPFFVLIAGQVLLFIRANDKLSLRVEQLQKDFDEHVSEVVPVVNEFRGIHELIKSLYRRFEASDRQAAEERQELVLALNSGIARVEARVSDLDRRVFDLVKNAKAN